jgi:hypothetical protein
MRIIRARKLRILTSNNRALRTQITGTTMRILPVSRAAYLESRLFQVRLKLLAYISIYCVLQIDYRERLLTLKP